MLSGQWNMEAGNLVNLLFAYRLSVHKQGHLGLIGVHLDFRFGLRTVDVSPAAEMDKRFVGEIGFVDVERVLADFAVKGDKPFLILSGLSTLVPAVSAEIKHIPAVHGPDIGAFLPHFQHVFVIHRLVTLRPITTFRVRRLISGIGVRAVFRQADHLIRMLGVIGVKPGVVILQIPQIPAIIQVIGADVSQAHQGMMVIQHKGVSHGRWPGWIKPMAKIVQQPVIFH